MTGERAGERDTGEIDDATRAEPGTREALERAASIAQTWTERAVPGIVRDTDGPWITRPRWRRVAGPVADAEALTGLRTAADVEHSPASSPAATSARPARTARPGGRSAPPLTSLRVIRTIPPPPWRSTTPPRLTATTLGSKARHSTGAARHAAA
jgi:hypothetical protein